MNDKLIEQFIAKGDSGRKYTVLCYQKQIPAGSHDDQNAAIPGLKRLVTSDGKDLNYQDEKTFTLVQTGEIIRRI